MIKLEKNKYGYYIANKSKDINYYKDKYYADHRFYKKKYNKIEIQEKVSEYDIYKFLIRKYLKNKKKNILEIGCGEGFGALALHKDYNYNAIELSDSAIKRHNPKIFKKINFFQGNFLNFSTKNKFDVILFHGVLEHLKHLNKTLIFIRKYLNKKGLLLINVPNDFNSYQVNYLNIKKILFNKAPFVNLEHKNYFNPTSLRKIFKEFECLSLFTNFPIDMFLLNDHTNYINNKSFGKIAYELFRSVEKLNKKDFNKYIKLGEAQAQLNIGRTITACFKNI